MFYKIYFSGDTFGDNILAAWTTNILNSMDIPAILWRKDVPEWFFKSVNCPDFYPIINNRDDFKHIKVNRTANIKNPGNFSMLYTSVNTALKRIGHNDRIYGDTPIDWKYQPVKFIEDLNAPEVDVCMVTITGDYTPYRAWPYFEELKKQLTSHGISFIDVSTPTPIHGQRFLNIVNKCKVFVTLDTGAGHYAANLAKGKTLALLSGFRPWLVRGGHHTISDSPNYTFDGYDYDIIESSESIPCAPCNLRKDCKYEHKCMTSLTVDNVFQAIMNKIEK